MEDSRKAEQKHFEVFFLTSYETIGGFYEVSEVHRRDAYLLRKKVLVCKI